MSQDLRRQGLRIVVYQHLELTLQICVHYRKTLHLSLLSQTFPTGTDGLTETWM